MPNPSTKCGFGCLKRSDLIKPCGCDGIVASVFSGVPIRVARFSDCSLFVLSEQFFFVLAA